VLVASGALVASVVQAQETDDESGAATASAALLDRFVRNVTTLTADFDQETYSVDQELVETAAGQFSLLRPARFVWHYETPFEQLVVADGETLWMYDVELEQVTRTPLDDVAAANPALLLSGERSVGEEFIVEREYRESGLDLVELAPRDTHADFSRVVVGFREEAPVLIEIVDGLNQTTRIRFSNVELNGEVDPNTFVFEPPPQADVIGAQ
jgi:outer membrane lipoprotein carrier protein